MATIEPIEPIADPMAITVQIMETIDMCDWMVRTLHTLHKGSNTVQTMVRQYDSFAIKVIHPLAETLSKINISFARALLVNSGYIITDMQKDNAAYVFGMFISKLNHLGAELKQFKTDRSYNGKLMRSGIQDDRSDDKYTGTYHDNVPDWFSSNSNGLSGGAQKARKKNVSAPAKWVNTQRTVRTKSGVNKVLYRNSQTGELRVRKLTARHDGSRKLSYVKV
jgi:hypothetical protein